MSSRGVLFVHSSSGRYGADRQLWLQATGLDPSRYHPLVVLPEQGPLADELHAAGVEVLVRQLGVIRRELMTPSGLASVASAALSDARVLGRLIRRRGIAVVHSNTSVILGGACAAALARVPHVWHVREIYTPFRRRWGVYRRVLTTATALPCVSKATAAQFGSDRRARVIHEGLAFDVTRAPRAQARAALGLLAEASVIAVLGRISDWKGQDILVRALAEPALRARGTIGLIAGDAWPGAESRRDRIVELASRLGVLDRVRMLGFRDDVETVLGAADIVAVPSTQPDPLPGSAIEAAAAGCAVIASAHGGLPEIIHDGQTGRLMPPSDPAAFANIASQLIDDPAERERLGAAAAQDVRRRFAPERLLESLQALYDETLDGRAAELAAEAETVRRETGSARYGD